MVPDHLDSDALLRLSQIIGNKRKGIPPIIPVSASTWWRWVDEGIIPRPIKLGPKTSAWRASDVLAFLESRQASEKVARKRKAEGQ